MFGWLRELLEIKYEFRERRTRLTTEVVKENETCQSCETLRQQLEIANYEKGQLLSKILKEPEIPIATEPIPITKPRMIPWAIKKQMLEQEDREKARVLRNAPKPDVINTSTEELEKDLRVAEVNREAKTGTE